MPLLLTILLILLLLIVIAVLYLLLVPIDLMVTGMLEPEGVTAEGGLIWGVAGFVAEQRQGNLRTAVTLFGHRFWFSTKQGRQKPEPAKPAEPAAKRREEREEHNEEKSGSPAPGAGEVISTVQEAWPRISDLLGTILRELEIRSVGVDMTFGLSDAAVTGEVFGYLMALRGILSPLPRFSMAVTPVFGTTPARPGSPAGAEQAGQAAHLGPERCTMKDETTTRVGPVVEAGGRTIVLIEEVRVIRVAGFLSVQKSPLGLMVTEGDWQYLFPFAEKVTLSWVGEHHPDLLRAPLL